MKQSRNKDARIMKVLAQPKDTLRLLIFAVRTGWVGQTIATMDVSPIARFSSIRSTFSSLVAFTYPASFFESGPKWDFRVVSKAGAWPDRDCPCVGHDRGASGKAVPDTQDWNAVYVATKNRWKK